MKRLFPIAVILFAVLGAASERDEVKHQMKLRPDDPWPRGAAHVLLAAPGSREAGYHEPGGSFSPGIGSFGVSLWVMEQGKLRTTSDAIPMADIRQRFVWRDNAVTPAIATTTPFYEAEWSHPGPGLWDLKLRWTAASTSAMLVVRSVGPAGGPVQSIVWKAGALGLNNRWSLSVNPPPKEAFLGDERHTRWITEGSDVPARVKSGWAYARLDLAGATEWTVRIQDPAPPHTFAVEGATTRAKISLEGAPASFSAALDAQVAHLTMGVLDWQARAGDPLNYPYPWLRDGAYVVTALARSGQIEAARRLALYFAEHDFFGGFGAEADAPGLALWAIEETASRAGDIKFDSRLWPHVRRKADFILEMANATTALHAPVDWPIVPRHSRRADITLIAEPAKDGLIVGRMDHHRPLLFVNAVNYRGLLSAVQMAQRLAKPAEAARWKAKAAQIKAAWTRALATPEAANERTFVSGIWPSGIAAPVPEAYVKGLEERWAKRRTPSGGFAERPLWTYFEFAEAHQWLMLGKPERAWQTLDWFFANQVSPGLYTWWEGEGEENNFGDWEQVRGWTNPAHVTPHYWTAAEMLLLSLDVLACQQPDGTVVIGAGVPSAWLAKPVSVTGLPLAGGKLDWSWNNGQLRVKTHGVRRKLKAGPGFPGSVVVIAE
jgi:hypothetical protein